MSIYEEGRFIRDEGDRIFDSINIQLKELAELQERDSLLFIQPDYNGKVNSEVLSRLPLTIQEHITESAENGFFMTTRTPAGNPNTVCASALMIHEDAMLGTCIYQKQTVHDIMKFGASNIAVTNGEIFYRIFGTAKYSTEQELLAVVREHPQNQFAEVGGHLVNGVIQIKPLIVERSTRERGHLFTLDSLSQGVAMKSVFPSSTDILPFPITEFTPEAIHYLQAQPDIPVGLVMTSDGVRVFERNVLETPRVQTYWGKNLPAVINILDTNGMPSCSIVDSYERVGNKILIHCLTNSPASKNLLANPYTAAYCSMSIHSTDFNGVKLLGTIALEEENIYRFLPKMIIDSC